LKLSLDVGSLTKKGIKMEFVKVVDINIQMRKALHQNWDPLPKYENGICLSTKIMKGFLKIWNNMLLE
jgi:hypothetical protein